MSEWTLCIDFGTAFSKAAAAPADAWSRFEPAEVRPLQLAGHEAYGNPFLLSSAVFVDEASVVFGAEAMARAEQLRDKKRMALRSFKTLLSVSDLDRALNTNAPASIDPHRVFQMRDLIVLYLAYLLAAIDGALDEDPILSEVSRLDLRYAAPAWRSGDSAGMHEPIVRLFGEADAYRKAMGERLLAPEGLGVDEIEETLSSAIQSAKPLEMGLIFEATAAAAYTSIGLEDASSHLIVVDMGAGTTDIAALARVRSHVFELPEVRVTLKQAGDFIDRVIANRILDTAKWAKTKDEQSRLWAAAMAEMDDIKEGVFADGRAVLRHEGRLITIAMRDIERDRDFRAFLAELTQAYEHGVAIVRDDARARGQSEVQAIAVGGGGEAPFIQELISRGRPGRPRVVPRPATPDWAHAREFAGNLAPVFRQLAIAIGGALAPTEMLAAGSGLKPRAGGRSGSRAARD